MAETPATQTTPSAVPEGKLRNGLIFGTIGVFSLIVFGLIYLFIIAPAAPTDGAGWSAGWFLFAFATGLTMIVMPCTLPLAFVIVPLSMGKGMMKGLSMALAFGLGVAATLSVYGIAAALIGQYAIGSLGAPLEVVKNWVYFVAGIFALVFALSEIGLLNFHMPTYSGAAPAFIQKRQEVVKAFLLGLFLGNIGVGCPHPATPLLLIEIASSGDVLYGWLMFLVHAIGRVLPLLLLAFMAILGVNGLNWLMTRKDMVEKVTGWAMVFVAGFILTLGLFTHDWWVNSGIHSALESITHESYFNAKFNENFDTNVAHVHGLEEGEGLFGLPLEWGHWFLVLVWLLPIWWWYKKKKSLLLNHPSFRLRELEKKIDLLERDRRQVESMVNLDDVETDFDLKARHAQLDALETERRKAEEAVQYGESGDLKSPVAQNYEVRLLRMHRNYLVAVSVFLILVFVHFMPENFYLRSMSGADDHHGSTDTGAHDHGSTPAPAANQVAKLTPFSTDIAGLPEATEPLFVELNDGDTYTITAGYVKKEVGNRMLRMLAYNNSIPGPFIKTTQGSTITINFVNNTDIDQTIHSHGVRLDNRFDGVPGVTQNVVKPGESFSYTVTFPDSGVSWYHPHTRDDYGQELGLYGNYIVDPTTDPSYNPVNREIPLVIDDILIENDRIANFYQETVDHALLGRFGNTYLVNGETDYLLDVQKDEVVRLQMTNVSNARTYRLSIPGAEMKKVGADLGPYEQEEFVDELLVSPAERLIVDVHFKNSGLHKLIHRMKDSTVVLAHFNVQDEIAEPSYVSEFNTARRNTTLKNEFDMYRSLYLTREPDKKALLTVSLTGSVDHSAHAHGGTGAATADTSHDHGTSDAAHDHGSGMTGMMEQGTGMMHNMGAMDMNTMMAQHHGADNIQWDDPTNSDKVNTTANVTWKIVDEMTGKENMAIDTWNFKTGQMVKVRFTNSATADHVMQHPIHFHGQRFLVLAENGVPNENMAWKDTALILPGGYIDILVDMSNPGVWMAHCHIIEHLFAGMMLPFRVDDQNGYAPGDEFRASLPSTKAAQGTSQAFDALALRDKYTFDSTVPQSTYTAIPEKTKYQAQKKEEVTVTIMQGGVSIPLSFSAPQPLRAVFVKSDGTQKIVTYTGNTEFDAYNPPHGASGHDNSDGHHDTGAPTAPASDGHNHIHMKPQDSRFAFVSTAHAHGSIDDGHTSGAYTYTMPIVFPERGVYRAFIEFIPEGANTVSVATFDIEVAASGFSVDNYGWSQNGKWWTLLIISIVLMTGLSVVVRKYIGVNT